MSIFDEVRALGLPLGQYVVFGSGPLAAHRIRESRDVDLLATPKLYKQLKRVGWEEKKWQKGGSYLSKDNVELDDSWEYGDYSPAPVEIINKAEIINGVPFASLEEVLRWKQAYGRPKDITDIKLIKNYLANLN